MCGTYFKCPQKQIINFITLPESWPILIYDIPAKTSKKYLYEKKMITSEITFKDLKEMEKQVARVHPTVLVVMKNVSKKA